MKTEKVYPVESLLQSEAFRGYQPDFARALLTKPAYTVREAKRILDHFFERGKR